MNLFKWTGQWDYILYNYAPSNHEREQEIESGNIVQVIHPDETQKSIDADLVVLNVALGSLTAAWIRFAICLGVGDQIFISMLGWHSVVTRMNTR